MKAKLNYSFILVFVPIVFSSFIGNPDKDKSFASGSKIVNGVTDETKIKATFNSGEEIFAYLSLKKGTLLDASSNRLSFGMDVDGKSLFRFTYTPYNAENKLNYFVFGIAVNPSNHMPDNHPRKEALNDEVLRELAKIPVGTHKITFGLTNTNGGFEEKMEFTITVTEEGQKTWATWSQEIEKMNKIYSYKTR